MATVMGPTPPGTGVMKPACSLAEAYWTSPTTRFPLGLLSSERNYDVKSTNYLWVLLSHSWNGIKTSPGTWLIPQSMTTAPFLIHSPFTISAFPMPTTRMSAFPTWICKICFELTEYKANYTFLFLIQVLTKWYNGLFIQEQEDIKSKGYKGLCKVYEDSTCE